MELPEDKGFDHGQKIDKLPRFNFGVSARDLSVLLFAHNSRHVNKLVTIIYTVDVYVMPISLSFIRLKTHRTTGETFFDNNATMKTKTEPHMFKGIGEETAFSRFVRTQNQCA